MPAKNSVKEFVSDSYYHIYNRGVEKRTIFQDPQDYAVFLSYLKTYLLPKDEIALRSVITDQKRSYKEKDLALKALKLNNFSDSLRLISYCLMPNHFHFLVKQTEAMTIDRFMQSFCTRYTLYFNRKYRRVGGLFQGLYKAVRITTDEQLLHVSRYIHRNPITLASQGTTLRSYTYSSYLKFLSDIHVAWVHPEDILEYFNKSGYKGYQKFVEGPAEEENLRLILTMTLDDE
ncbi:MAG: transposase [Patescibacteria group bacterium]